MALGDDDASADTLQFIFIVCAWSLCVCARECENASAVTFQLISDFITCSNLHRRSPFATYIAAYSFCLMCRVCKFRLLGSHARHQRHIFFCSCLQRNDLSHTHIPMALLPLALHTLSLKRIKEKRGKKVVSTNCLLRTVVARNVAALDVDVTFFYKLQPQYVQITHIIFIFIAIIMFLSLRKFRFSQLRKLCLIFIDATAAAWETHSHTAIVVEAVRVNIVTLPSMQKFKRHFSQIGYAQMAAQFFW